MGEAARVLIEDVHEAIFDLVELIKTFQSKNKLSKLFLSTLFKRRQDELDAVVDRAITRLQVTELNLLVGVANPKQGWRVCNEAGAKLMLVRLMSPQLRVGLLQRQTHAPRRSSAAIDFRHDGLATFASKLSCR